MTESEAAAGHARRAVVCWFVRRFAGRCGGRAVEGTRLEIVQTQKGLVGSNPTRTAF